VSLCVFTFNSFCRRPRAAQQHSHSSIQHNIKRNPGTPSPRPPPPSVSRPLWGSGGRLTTSGLGKKKRGTSQTFQLSPSFLPFSSSLSVFRLSLRLVFFPPFSSPNSARNPDGVCPTRLHTDRNSEKLIFLRRSPAAPAPLLFPLALTRGFVSIADVYSVARLRERRKRVLVGRSGTAASPSRVPSERAQSTNEQQ